MGWVGGKRWKRIVVTVAQTEPTTLHRFAAAVGLGKVRGPYRVGSNPRWAQAWYWSVEGPERVGQVLDILWPYLSEPKRQQIEKCIDQWDEYQQSLSLRRV